MDKNIIENRNIHKVCPQLDGINKQYEYDKDFFTEEPIFTVWGRNLKPYQGDKSTQTAVKGLLKGGAALALGAIGAGAGVSGSMAMGVAKSGNGLGDAIAAMSGDIIVTVRELCTKEISKIEYFHWGRFNFLQNFVPAQGYLGELVKGEENSDGYNGHCFYENGDYFEGFFYNDGARFGAFVFSNGVRAFGTIYNGFYEDDCVVIYPDGSRDYGTFEHGQLAYGLSMNNDCAWAGEWSNGTLHGFGCAKFADGACFYGDWINGQPQAN